MDSLGELDFDAATEPEDYGGLLSCQDNAYYSFTPRPDQPDRDDQQASFVNSKARGVAFLLGGNGAGTTECAMAKVARFVLNEQRPPRRDTPFWIISDTLSNTIKNTWKEKLSPETGHGHIPSSEIDWDRISWYRQNEVLPLTVPLKDPVGCPGRNWVLEFKSFDQGVNAMRGQSLGGFCFVEQFPWDILTEVLRGCREYNFPGSKFCEFTPIDPDQSYELEMMIERDALPQGWEVWYANTECAVEAGHVSSEWFNEYFGMIPASMRATRCRGKFASYEGAVYPQFKTSLHLVGDDVIDFPDGAFHRRSIDWGSGPENAFCCLWAYKNSLGQWFVYDEYYSTAPVTTIEHLCEIGRRSKEWGWKKNHPEYGQTYADPSSPGDIRIANNFATYSPKGADGKPLYDQISVTSAANSVRQGIEHVQWLLQPAAELAKPYVNGRVLMIPQPRLFIHGKRCPHLARQMRTYRYHRASEAGLNPQNPRMEPVKKDDHACFPAGQLVDTPGGPRPIETLIAGDLVYSHRGVARVQCGAVKTGTKETVRVHLSDGRSIQCTAEHPIAIGQNRWRSASDSLGEMLNVRESCEPRQQEMGTRSRLLSMAGLNGVDIQRTRGTRLGDTSGEVHVAEQTGSSAISGFTSKSTSTTLDPSPMDATCITKTAMPGTTTPETFRKSQNESTHSFIGKASRRPLRLLRNGTAARPENNGTPSTAQEVGLAGSLGHFNASSVANDSRLATHERRRDSVPASAGMMRELKPALMTNSENVKSAIVSSQRTVTQRRLLARKNVLQKRSVSIERLTGKRDVYNIATSDGTFFVNGVLVSNCDALRYLCFTESNRAGYTPGSMSREHSAERHGVHAVGAARAAAKYGAT